VAKIQTLARDAAARASTPTLQTITVSTKPRPMLASCAAATGADRVVRRRISGRTHDLREDEAGDIRFLDE